MSKTPNVPQPSLAPTPGLSQDLSQNINPRSSNLDDQWRSYYDMIKKQQAENNAWSAAQAQKAMDYQTDMSNTAHQREVADLKAAGLNPVLSAGGAGATTGSGIATQAGSENITALYGLMSKAFQASIDQAKAAAESAKAQQQTVTMADLSKIVSGITAKRASSGKASGKNEDSAESESNPHDVITDSPVVNVIEGFLKRFLGVQPEDVDALIDKSLSVVDKIPTLDEIKQSHSGKAFHKKMQEMSAYDDSALDFIAADLDENGFLSQYEMSRFKNQTGRLPGEKESSKRRKRTTHSPRI